MIKTMLTFLGWGFIAIGVIGFVAPAFLGAHLSVTHNAVHLVSGAAALWFGSKGSLQSAKTFSIAFGAVYGLLGVVGFIWGAPDAATVANLGRNENLLVVIPGALELGTVDHVIHIALAAIFLVGAMRTHPIETRGRERRMAVS